MSPQRTPLHLRLKSRLLARPLWTDGAPLLVAVSGGPDSTALLLLLRELKQQATACFVDHGIRNVETERTFLRALCNDHGIPLHTRAPAPARETENDLRRLRYESLALAARELGAGHVATGHTADDQVETVLMRILRGSAMRGVGGMRASRALPVTGATGNSIHVVRPLLPFRRREIQVWLRDRGITAVTDPTNTDPRFLRNRIRHTVLPALREMNPQLDTAILRLASAAREAGDAVEYAAASAANASIDRRDPLRPILQTKILAELPTALRLEILRRFALLVPGRSGELSRVHLEALDGLARGPNGKHTVLPGGIHIAKKDGLLRPA